MAKKPTAKKPAKAVKTPKAAAAAATKKAPAKKAAAKKKVPAKKTAKAVAPARKTSAAAKPVAATKPTAAVSAAKPSASAKPAAAAKGGKTATLPFWETIRRTFSFTIDHAKAAFQVSAAWFLLIAVDAFSGFSISQPKGAEDGSWASIALSILFLASYAAIFVAFARLVVLGAKTKWFQLAFGKRELKVIAYSFLLSLAFILATALAITAIYYLFNAAGVPLLPYIYAPIIVIVLLLVPALIRLSLAFVGIAADNAAFRFKKAWKVSTGNSLRMLGGLLAVMLPLIAVNIALAAAIAWLAGWLEVSGAAVGLVFSALFFAVSFLQTVLSAAYFSHAYLYLSYFDRK